ncbi:stimulated by retinoic acid gene 6 protein-like isoform X2 [Mixophyes fleayi]|uniref:stimulated by retinoic acid gene 6 protein-like isoform X2 n=1 Tax=Mixophyes fleayi TaxID=3061075 RepID=UPI003F4DB219
MSFHNERTIQENYTCKSQVNMDLFLHYSLIPSVLIILALSFLERRINRTQFDEKIQLLDRRFGFVIPLDLIGTFNNRWTFGFAFGAIANKVMSLFSEEYLPVGVPSWARALGLLVGAIEVGLSYYPIFACLSTNSKIIGSLTGFLYTLTWFIVTMIDITSCPHGKIIGYFEKVIFYWPSILCLVFLMGRFVHIFIKFIRIYMGADIQHDEICFLPIHQAEHVKRLLRKPVEVQKSWFERKIYTWDPCFKFPSRMIGTTVLSLFCLYIFLILEYSVGRTVTQQLYRWEEQMVQMAPDMTWEGYNQTVASFKEFNGALVGVWFFTTFFASAVTVSYIFHILVCYRKHMKRLWIGEKGFLPIKYQKPLSSQCVAAIARYSGWQVAYILWGYLIMHTVQSIFGLAFAYGVVFPIKHGQAIIFLKGLGISMKAFHNFNYFFFFYNVILGLGACLFRLLCSLILGSWLVARIDRTILQRGYESADMGYNTWIGMIYVDHYHTNPVLVSFCNILLTMTAEKRLKASPAYCVFSNSAGPRTSIKARTRWLLYYTLLKNPRLIIQRKLKELDDVDFTQTRLVQASVMEAEIRNNQERPIDVNCIEIRERRSMFV